MVVNNDFEARYCPYCGKRILARNGEVNICKECGSHFLVVETGDTERKEEAAEIKIEQESKAVFNKMENDYIAEYVKQKYPSILGVDYAFWKFAKKINNVVQDLASAFKSIDWSKSLFPDTTDKESEE